MHKVFVEGNDHRMFELFDEHPDYVPVPSIFQADLLCLEGGSDVSPHIYGKEKHELTQSSIGKDHESFGLLALAVAFKIPVVGVCRGAQVINVFNGGKMEQHIEGHSGAGVVHFVGEGHKIAGLFDLVVSYDHHQACILEGPNELLAVSHEGWPEGFYYRDRTMFGWQPHPEWSPKPSAAREVFFRLLKETMDAPIK